MTDLTQLTDDPEIESVESNGKVNGSEYVSRWTNYGHDRLYINNWSRADIWLNLQTGEVEHDNAGGARYTVEVNEDAHTVTIRFTGQTEREMVINLAPNAETESTTDDTENDTDDESGESPSLVEAVEGDGEDEDDEESYAEAVMAEPIGKEIMTDGGQPRKEWLLYGQPADVIDEPEKVFARHDDEFVLMPIELLDRDVVEEHEHIPGEIFLDGISADDGYFDIVDSLESVDIDQLVKELETETVYSKREAEMVVLGGWFGMDRQAIAEEVNLSKHTVRNHIEAARERREKAKATVNKLFAL